MMYSMCQRFNAISRNQHQTKGVHENSHNTVAGGKVCKSLGKSRQAAGDKTSASAGKSRQVQASLAKPMQVGWQQKIRYLGSQVGTLLVESQYGVVSKLVQSCFAIGTELVRSVWDWYETDEDSRMLTSVCKRLIAISWNQQDTKGFHRKLDDTGDWRNSVQTSRQVQASGLATGDSKSRQVYANLGKPR